MFTALLVLFVDIERQVPKVSLSMLTNDFINRVKSYIEYELRELMKFFGFIFRYELRVLPCVSLCDVVLSIPDEDIAKMKEYKW